MVLMSVREFMDYVSSGDIYKYEKARDMFANPVKYYDRGYLDL